MISEKGIVPFGKKNIVFSVIRSNRRRTVSIFVDPIDGVFLRSPESSSMESLAKLVSSKATWILSKQRWIDETIGHLSKREFITGESFLYLGKHLRLRVVKLNKKSKPGVIVKGERFIISLNGNVSDADRASAIKDILIHWYKQHAGVILHKRIRIYVRKLGVITPKILLGNQTKRWGSCNRKNEIRFNWHIIMAPMSLVDYIVTHELCHLKYINHSEDFWKLLGSIMPDYETRRERLRKEGPRYIF